MFDFLLQKYIYKYIHSMFTYLFGTKIMFQNHKFLKVIHMGLE